MSGASPGRGHPGRGSSPGKAQASRPTLGLASQVYTNGNVNPKATVSPVNAASQSCSSSVKEEKALTKSLGGKPSPVPAKKQEGKVSVSDGIQQNVKSCSSPVSKQLLPGAQVRSAPAVQITSPASRQRRTSLERQTMQENLQQHGSMACSGRTRSQSGGSDKPAAEPASSQGATKPSVVDPHKTVFKTPVPVVKTKPVEPARAPELQLADEIPGLVRKLGGPYGAVGVDLAFEKMLCKIFGEDFIQTFKVKRPAAWVDLMIAFEARKRTAAPQRSNHLNISLPFSFIDFYRRHTRQNVETALRKSSVNFVKWSSQGMLRMSSEAMNELFQPTIQQIVQHIGDLVNKPEVSGIKYLFLVGGFAESPMLQNAVQSAFSEVCRVIIPQDVGLTILKGAVLFGLDPTVVRVRRSPLTYGVGVLNKFVEGKHPKEKLLLKEGKNWCTDIFDKFVSVDQSVALGDIVQRSYCPARLGQRKIIINIYCSSSDDVVYITDAGVRKCGTINLDLPDINEENGKILRREIKASMQFGDTEIKVTAMDVKTAKTVRAAIDFLSN
ncbi:heat shock 70 kDa protein 12B isoform X3 [Dendrobates tinctorius]|uniref:heat shock 70 kDa protein 12B isoform X3 n=1 Tax=Dendrobates tinctorius TaxID=92724 RepID=UPI003CCA5DF6